MARELKDSVMYLFHLHRWRIGFESNVGYIKFDCNQYYCCYKGPVDLTSKNIPGNKF